MENLICLQGRLKRLVGLIIGINFVLFGIHFQLPVGLATTELLTNGGFEAQLTDWVARPGTTGVAIIGDPVHQGSGAIAISSESNSVKSIVQNITPIEAGSVYTLTGFGLKNDTAVTGIRLRLAWYEAADCSGSQLQTVDSNPLIDNTPTYIFMTTGPTVAPPQAQCAQVRAQLNPAGAALATAYFDDLSFTVNRPGGSMILPTPTPIIIPSVTWVVFSEIAWAGTAASANDEWLELWNITDQAINLAGWSITSADGLTIPLVGMIEPNSGFLLERSDDTTIADIAADQLYTGSLSNDGTSLFLHNGVEIVDSVNVDGGSWPAGSGSPTYASMERLDLHLPDTDDNWASANFTHQNGLDAAGQPLYGTPGQVNSTTYPPPPLVALKISELLYDGLTPSTEGDEFVEICNPTAETADLSSYKLGDEESAGAGEGMYQFPTGAMLPPDACLIVAKNGAQFADRFGFAPHFEAVVTGEGYVDSEAIPNLNRYSSWGSGQWALTNHGDEFLLLGPSDQMVDAVAYRDGLYDQLSLQPKAAANEPFSLQRVWPQDQNWMAVDFVTDLPSPGQATLLPTSFNPTPAAALPDGLNVYLGSLRSQSTFSGGDGPPAYLFAKARSNGLHFLGITDLAARLSQPAWHELGVAAANSTEPGQFAALRGLIWSPENGGPITLFGLSDYSSVASLTNIEQIYSFLTTQPTILGQFTPSTGPAYPYNVGLRDNIVLQSLPTEDDGGLDLNPLHVRWNQGWHLAPASDNNLTSPNWGQNSGLRTGLIAPALTQPDLMLAIQQRRTFATTTPDLGLAFQANGQWQGAHLPPADQLDFSIYPIAPNAKPTTLTLYDQQTAIAETTVTPPQTWSVSIPGRAGHYYWVSAQQPDDDMAVAAPIWITGQLEPDLILISEILPNPGNTDWNGDGEGNGADEWVEFYNPNPFPVNMGGWTFEDKTRQYTFSPDAVVPAGGYYLLFRTESRIALNNDEDLLILKRPDGSVSDAISYHDSPDKAITVCRKDEIGDWWTHCIPSPAEANILLAEPGPLKLNIYEAKRVTRGAWVQVDGYVTVPPGIFGRNVIYIQDDSHGIRVKLPSKHEHQFELGDHLEITGILDNFWSEWEIDIKGEGSRVKPLSGKKLMAPLPVTSGQLSDGYEGLLVQITVMPTHFEPRRRHFWGDDGTGPALVYIYGPSSISRRYLQRDQPVTIVGVVNQRAEGHAAPDGYRISPRYQFDLIQAEATIDPVPEPPVPADWPTALPSLTEDTEE